MKYLLPTLALALAASLPAQTPTISDPFSVFNRDNPVWTVDRYAPQYFGPGQVGADNTIAINISAQDGINNRPSPFGGVRFYNTQGYQLGAGPVNFTLSTFTVTTTLYVGASYLTNAQRTDLWVNSAPASAPGTQDLFSIAGISNVNTQVGLPGSLQAYAGGAQFQYFNQFGTFVGIHTLTAADVDKWWTVTITLTNLDADNTMQSFSFTDGVNVYSASEIVNAPGAADVVANTVWLQAYNFAGESIAGGALTQNNYTADWARGVVVVPEPATVLAGLGALGLVGVGWRRRMKR